MQEINQIDLSDASGKNPKADKLLIDSTVIGLHGFRGSGKSLLASYLTAHAHYTFGTRVFHNNVLNFGEVIEVEDLIDLTEDVSNAIILIDEIQTIGDSVRATSTLSYLFTQMLMQLRKRKIIILWTSQNLRQINSRILWQTDFLVECATPQGENAGKIVMFEIVSNGTVAPEGQKQRGRLYRAERFWNYYDTGAIIDSTKSIMIDSNFVKQQRKNNEKDKVQEILTEAAKQYDELYLDEIKTILKQNGVEQTDNMLGRWLKDILEPHNIVRTREGRVYYLEPLKE
tara:strand:- start:5524 stop:6381 length:858 start_codon:yes stop_codon:yes gene_type:complete